MDQKTADRIKTLQSAGKTKEEIYAELLKSGASVESIHAGFAALSSDKEDTHQKTINIILTVAAVLVGAGIFSFIASNWDKMGSPVKIAVILSAMIASYSLGWYLKEEKHFIKTGDSLILLGTIIYGAGIFLVAQIFQIRANWPDGFIFWMFGVLAVAYATSTYHLYYFAIPLGIIALFGHPFIIFAGPGYNSFLLTPTIFLLLATAVTFVVGLFIRKKVSRDVLQM